MSIRQDHLRQSLFPRYRGVNLDGMFCAQNSAYASVFRRGYFIERDFAETAEMGFDFVRLPLSYQLFTTPENPDALDGKKLERLDEAVEWGRKYHLHVNINFHRAPGYCVNDDVPDDRFLLYRDPEALEFFAGAWRTLARRYKGISNENVTFDLLNEPSSMRFTLPGYVKVMRETIAAIHDADPDRFCMIDGWAWGEEPIEELGGIPLVGQSCRGYHPRELTHYKVYDFAQKTPTWPMTGHDDTVWDGERLDAHFRKWTEFSCRTNTPIHCGECGCINNTPKDALLAWAEDLLKILEKYNIGFAWWTMRGKFGLYRELENPDSVDAELLAVLQKH